MTGVAQGIDIRHSANERERRSEWAPHRQRAQQTEIRDGGRLNGFWVVAAFLLFSGVTVAAARGYSGMAESYQVSPETLLGLAWLVQGATALVCFLLAIRWLRS